MPAERHKRISKAIHHCMQEMIRYELGARKIDSMTEVTKVEISPDLRMAHIFIYPPVLSEQKPEKILEEFNRSKKFIRKRIAEYINIRYALNIEFILDIAYGKGDEVLQLLDQIKKREDND